jgi:uncharacterized membrane protein YdjX (TVP38/TMEM64 family)
VAADTYAAPCSVGGPYGVLVGGLLILLLVAFLVVEALDVPVLTDPSPWLDEGGLVAAALGVGLLVLDVFIPVPSSGVMVAQGALFGVVLGTLLSLTGGLGATLLGFLVGRRSRRLVDRIVPAEEQDRAERLLSRYGALAIIATRPVPMLTETTAIIAGTSATRVAHRRRCRRPRESGSRVGLRAHWRGSDFRQQPGCRVRRCDRSGCAVLARR